PPAADPRIKSAVDSGVAFLKAQLLAQRRAGTPFPVVDKRIPDQSAGIAGLVGLTLLECGVPANDSAVQRAADLIRERGPHISKVYVLSAALFFLNRWNEASPLQEKDR